MNNNKRPRTNNEGSEIAFTTEQFNFMINNLPSMRKKVDQQKKKRKVQYEEEPQFFP